MRACAAENPSLSLFLWMVRVPLPEGTISGSPTIPPTTTGQFLIARYLGTCIGVYLVVEFLIANFFFPPPINIQPTTSKHHLVA